MELRLSFFALAFLFVLNLHSQKQGEIYVNTFVLDNGLTVYLNEDHNATKVFGAVVVNAGSKNDPANSTGIAHYLEHMLFKGTQTIGTWNWPEEQKYMNKIISLYDELGEATEQTTIDSIQKEINKNTVEASKYNMPNEFDKLINNIGGTGLNAFTSEDMTFYHNSFPSSQINKWLTLYSERLLNPVFRSFQSELEVVYEEKNRSMDNFIFKIFEELNENMFKGHPYGTQTTLGSVEHLKKPSLTKMYEFYKKYYVASNMALIIVGNFNASEITPLIKKEFGRLPKGEHAVTSFNKPKGFTERTLIKRRYTPVKLGILGYKTIPENNPDNYVIEVITNILNNENQTGLLDKLTTNNKLMISEAMPMPYKDDGALIIYYLPKIVGQSLDKAEDLVKQEVTKVKMGEFSIELMENAKQMLIQNHEFMMEDIEERGIELGNMYVMGKSIEEFNSYVDNIKKITKDDIKRVAGKYFGDGYFALQSKMGFPKKTKLDKPGFDPVKPVQFKTSDFAEKFNKTKGTRTQAKYIDFNKDVETINLGEVSVLIANKNPYNDLFSLTISYNVGKNKYKELPFIKELLSISGTDKYSVDTLKTKFADLGVTYYFSVDNNNFDIELEGNPKGLKEALTLINDLLNNPKFNEDQLKQVVNMIQNERKMTYKDPSAMGQILLYYSLFKENSSYLRQPSIKEYKKYTEDSIKTILKELTSYSANVYYTGNISAKNISEYINNTFVFNKNTKKEAYLVREAVYNSKNKVYFINDKKAIQSQVYFYVNGGKYEPKSYPYINAFNTYFGRGFSGLVMQEIREYRSMAYSAYGYYTTPFKTGKKSTLIAYVGCQADKTIDAIEIMDSLILRMPKKPERIDMIRNKLYLEAQTSYPSFREIPEKIGYYKKFNINSDPNKDASEVYKNLSFDDIYKFYLDNIAKKSLIITVYGDKKKIDMNKLQEYGKFFDLSKPDIYYY